MPKTRKSVDCFCHCERSRSLQSVVWRGVYWVAVLLTVTLASCESTGDKQAGRDIMFSFNHVGLVTEQVHEGEEFVAATRVWVTNPHKHPFKIEWLRFEPDSPVTGPVRTEPHVAFSVADLKVASKGLEVLMEPFDVGFAVVGFYKTDDGAVIELMQYKENAEWSPQ